MRNWELCASQVRARDRWLQARWLSAPTSKRFVSTHADAPSIVEASSSARSKFASMFNVASSSLPQALSKKPRSGFASAVGSRFAARPNCVLGLGELGGVEKHATTHPMTTAAMLPTRIFPKPISLTMVSSTVMPRMLEATCPISLRSGWKFTRQRCHSCGRSASPNSTQLKIWMKRCPLLVCSFPLRVFLSACGRPKSG
mmetsp:Transcript_9832/g.30339  ORF Transcript_9832/g.30339 Transcript_9832/m.30339 type:complete len:200 (+) Transcript_9832:222-821(+)